MLRIYAMKAGERMIAKSGEGKVTLHTPDKKNSQKNRLTKRAFVKTIYFFGALQRACAVQVLKGEKVLRGPGGEIVSKGEYAGGSKRENRC